MSERKKRPGAMLYFELIPVIEQLSDETAGRFIKGIMYFARDGTEPNFSDNQILSVLWPMVRERLAKDNERYIAVCMNNSQHRKYGAYKAKRLKAGRDYLPFSDWQERQEESGENPFDE